MSTSAIQTFYLFDNDTETINTTPTPPNFAALANSVYLSANCTPLGPPYGSHLDVASAGRIDGSATKRHRGELTGPEKYEYDLRRAQLKASSRTSALLAGFAMVALVELQYDNDTPPALLVILGFVTTILVSVHLIALMTSTCILPHIEASGCTEDSPHKQLEFFITMSWTFSTCIGLLLFLVEIVLIFFVKFSGVHYMQGAWIMLVLLVPVFIAFGVISYKIHHRQQQHSVNRVNTKINNMEDMIKAHDHSHDFQKTIDSASPIQVV